MKQRSLEDIATFDAETGDLQIIVETPQGDRNKYKYDADNQLFKLHKVLPAGASFPYDFGFIPSTLAEDGDPMDVLVLMDEPAFQGNLVTARLIGVIEAEQEEEGKMIRNDRLIAIAAACRDYANVRELNALSPTLLGEIEHFFVSYNAIEERCFKPLCCKDAAEARSLVEAGRKRYSKQKK